MLRHFDSYGVADWPWNLFSCVASMLQNEMVADKTERLLSRQTRTGISTSTSAQQTLT